MVEISGFTNSQFSTATVDRTQIQLPSGYSFQLEGIAPINAINYFISTEQSFTGASGLFRLKLDASASVIFLNNPSTFIYPNPASHTIFVDCEHGTQVELYALNGKQMIRTTEHEIDVSTLSKSTYILLLRKESGEIITQQKVFVD